MRTASDTTAAVFTNPLTATAVAIDTAKRLNAMPGDIASSRVRAYRFVRRGQMLGWTAMWRDSAGLNRLVTNDDADAVTNA